MSKVTGFRFPRCLRVRKRDEFARLMRNGRRAGDSRLLIWMAPNGGDDPRLGLVVGKRQGNAVRRARLKRLIREAFRLSRTQIPAGYDIACSPRPGAVLGLSLIADSLVQLSRRLVRRIERETAARDAAD